MSCGKPAFVAGTSAPDVEAVSTQVGLFGDAAQSGPLAVVELLNDCATTQVVVDLQERTIQAGALTAPFRIDDYTRWRLLEGLDDIGITLSHEEDVTSFESRRPSWKPATL